jgi:hypothetical protein
MWQVWGTGEVHTGFWLGTSDGRGLLGRHRHRWEGNVKMDQEVDGDAWTGLIWLGIGTSGRQL